jgi:hypothetical protein
VLADLIETEATCFLFRIVATGAKSREVVVAIHHRRVIQVTNSGGVRCADQRVECERGRPVAARQPFD